MSKLLISFIHLKVSKTNLLQHFLYIVLKYTYFFLKKYSKYFYVIQLIELKDFMITKGCVSLAQWLECSPMAWETWVQS